MAAVARPHSARRWLTVTLQDSLRSESKLRTTALLQVFLAKRWPRCHWLPGSAETKPRDTLIDTASESTSAAPRGLDLLSAYRPPSPLERWSNLDVASPRSVCNRGRCRMARPVRGAVCSSRLERNAKPKSAGPRPEVPRKDTHGARHPVQHVDVTCPRPIHVQGVPNDYSCS